MSRAATEHATSLSWLSRQRVCSTCSPRSPATPRQPLAAPWPGGSSHDICSAAQMRARRSWMRRMCEGAVKCALRDFRRELTPRWQGAAKSIGRHRELGQARGTSAYDQVSEPLPSARTPASRRRARRAAPAGVFHGHPRSQAGLCVCAGGIHRTPYRLRCPQLSVSPYYRPTLCRLRRPLTITTAKRPATAPRARSHSPRSCRACSCRPTLA